jgi:hypothetical protein
LVGVNPPNTTSLELFIMPIRPFMRSVGDPWLVNFADPVSVARLA